MFQKPADESVARFVESHDSLFLLRQDLTFLHTAYERQEAHGRSGTNGGRDRGGSVKQHRTCDYSLHGVFKVERVDGFETLACRMESGFVADVCNISA